MHTHTIAETTESGRRTSASTGAHAPVLRIDGASVDGPRGRVFGPLSATSTEPVTVVTGTKGSGRTALLLTIAGRMRTATGAVETLGETRTGEIRNMTGIAGFAGIDDLEPAVTVAATLRERLSWELPWWRRTPRITAAVARELLDPAFGATRAGEEPLDVTQLCRELGPADDSLVRIALALIARPELLVVDDLDALRDPADRARVAARLREISRRLPVVVATSDARDAGLFGEPARIAL